MYLHGLAYLLSRAGRRADAVVDIINGLPFAAPLVRRRGLVALVHHVHREQWRMIYPGLGGRVGWFVESRVVPRLYRRVPFVTVSEASRHDLVALGLDDVVVVRNGTRSSAPRLARSATPRLCVLSRLVPHKQIEQAVERSSTGQTGFPSSCSTWSGTGGGTGGSWSSPATVGSRGRIIRHGRVSEEGRDLLRAWRCGWAAAVDPRGLGPLDARGGVGAGHRRSRTPPPGDRPSRSSPG